MPRQFVCHFIALYALVGLHIVLGILTEVKYFPGPYLNLVTHPFHGDVVLLKQFIQFLEVNNVFNRLIVL